MENRKYYPGHPFIESLIKEAAQYSHALIDCFCGMGGFTSGFESTGNYKVIACINHWDVAIKTHKRNHPNCLHIEEDFRKADLSLIQYMVRKIRSINPFISIEGSFGLECTNHSIAKGGMPRDNDSRTLAEHVYRYQEMLEFDELWIENVKEFLLWGGTIPKIVHKVKGKNKVIHFNPKLDSHSVFAELPGASCPLHIKKKKGKIISIGEWLIPDPATKGVDFKRWRKSIEDYGFHSENKILNAADYGVPQHRKRMIMQFVRKGVPIAWPEPTHSKTGENGLPKWLPIGPCLNLNDIGTDLLSFRTIKKTGQLKPRITSNASIKRLIKGTIKNLFLQPETISKTKNSNLALTHLVDYYFGNGYTTPITTTGGVTGTKDGAALHTIQLVSEFRNNGQPQKITDTAKAIVTKDKFSLDTIKFIAMRYTGGGQQSALNKPAPAATGVPKHTLLHADTFIWDTQYNNESASIKTTSKTLHASRKHFYIINGAWFDGHSKPITEASATLIARQDKMPQYLVVTETGHLAIEVYPHDPPHYVAFKRFMADFGIVRVTMRMLYDKEMLKIQSFDPRITKLTRSATNNKKMIGNAVPPKMIHALGVARYNAYKQYQQKLVAA